MTHPNSLDAYREIKAQGLLKGLQFDVYQFFNAHGPCSINFMLSLLATKGKNTGSLTGRISELVKLGVLYECGIETAPTGKRVARWDTTNKLPVKPEKRETSTQIITRLTTRVDVLERLVLSREGTIRALEAEVKDMKQLQMDVAR